MLSVCIGVLAAFLVQYTRMWEMMGPICRRALKLPRIHHFRPAELMEIAEVDPRPWRSRMPSRMRQMLFCIAIALLSRLTDAAEMPANRATCRTPMPAANSCLARISLALAIGGLPNRTMPRTAA